MAYLSLYRKWRPQSFDDVVGQEHVVRTLKNALESRRTAHAYIFAGPRGTGKTTLARLLAKGLNCEHGPTGSPCNQCANCARITRGASVDVIEIDGASNRGIDEIRDVREMVKFAPAEGEYKVYIIDEVHMLTTEAFNALLKVLEEPPAHVVFVFATTEPHKIPATIVSRCQKFDFRSFTIDEIATQLEQVAGHEGVSIDRDALALIALHSEGGMRDALGYLDQCIAFASDHIHEGVVAQVLGVVEAQRLEELAGALAQDDLGRCLTLVKAIADEGRDLKQFAADAVRYFRDLLVLAAAPGSRDLVAMTEDGRKKALAMAEKFSVARLLQIVEALGRAEGEMRWASTAQFPLEMALIQLVRDESRTDLDGLVRRVEALERRLAQAPPVAAPHEALALSSGTSTQVQRAAAASEAPVRRSVPTAEAEITAPQAGEEILPSRAPLEKEGDKASPLGEELAEAYLTVAETAGAESSQVHSDEAASPSEQSLLRSVQSAWPKILETLRANRNVQQEAFLREGSPVAVQGDTVIVGFSPNHRFHQANMEKDKNRAIVEKAMSKVLGRTVRMQAVLGLTWESVVQPKDPNGPDAGRAIPSGEEAPGTGAAREFPQPGEERSGGERLGPTEGEPVVVGETVDPDEIDEPILKAALKLFGGTITRIERKEADQS